MESLISETPNEAAWLHIAPLLDEALANLNETDRRAVLLRYFDGQTLGEVGAALSLNEDAARKRVNRGVEKLRKFFVKRGVTQTAAAIGVALTANSVQAAPVGLAVTVTATAAKGAVASGSTLSLVKGTMKLMTWVKFKFAIIGALALIGATTSLIVISNLHGQDLHPSRPVSLGEIQQLFDFATAAKPQHSRFEADIELITPRNTEAQNKELLTQIEGIMHERNRHLSERQKVEWEITQSNAIITAHSGKRIQHVREWYSGNYYRLDMTDEAMGTQRFIKTHPNEYYETYVDIPNSPFSPYASYEVNRELRSALLTKQNTTWHHQYDLWQAIRMGKEMSQLLVIPLVDLWNSNNFNLPHPIDFRTFKLDPTRAQKLHEQSDSNWRMEATDEKLDGRAVTRIRLKGSPEIPAAVKIPIKLDTYQMDFWVGQVSGNAVCLQETLTNLTQHTSTISKREKFDKNGLPGAWTTITVKPDSSVEKQRVTFKSIETDSSFTDEETFAPVFPITYTVSDVTSGTGVFLQKPSRKIPVGK